MWADDHSTCTATATCANDASHTYSETATVSTVVLNVTATKVTYTYNVAFANASFEAQTKVVEGDVALVANIATINAPAINGRVASHDYVKFDFHNAEATHTFTIYYSECDVWDGTSVSTSLSGSGTEEDPYLIQSAADLAYIKSVVDATAGGKGANYNVKNFAGQYFKMTKSIDLNGADFMIGYHKGWNEYEAFCGIFDGNNCTIRGLNINPANSGSTGLFACVSNGGIIKNLSLYGEVNGNATVGSAVAYLVTKNSTVENVTNYATIKATGKTVGGVVANAENNQGVIKNCVNYGTVTSSANEVGGIVGISGYTISCCKNFGQVEGTYDVGGISGNSKNGINITDSDNYGLISGTTEVGGICGTVLGKVTGCTNYGTVTGTGGVIGGIAGESESGTTISSCTNNGEINGLNTTGGICGLASGTVTDCTNNGIVKAEEWNVGGIAGRSSSTSAVSKCTNYGDVTCITDCAGGIIGAAQANLSECKNYGTVRGTGRCGGIAYSSTATIDNCINYGDVIGGWDLGGILAYVGDGISATITNCTNNGNITGSWNNGGIFGLAHDNAGTVTITGCTNNGHIVSTTGGQISISVKAVITDCTENGSWKAAE